MSEILHEIYEIPKEIQERNLMDIIRKSIKSLRELVEITRKSNKTLKGTVGNHQEIVDMRSLRCARTNVACT